MKNENMKCNVVIRVCNNSKGITVERGFIDVDKAKEAYLFLDCVCDKVDIFFRLDWFAGDDMPGFDGEYWFGKRKERETE